MKLDDVCKKLSKEYFYLIHLSYGTGENDRRELWDYASKHNVIGLSDPEYKINKNWFKYAHKYTENEIKQKVGKV